MKELPEEFAPLSGWDEYPIHQAVTPIRYMHTIDPRAFERYWFTAEARDGALMLVTGMGFYPNLGIADGYALLVIGDRQITVRAQRALSGDRGQLTVGPVRADPVRPFAEWRLELGDNEHGLRYDLRWRDTKRASFRKMDMTRRLGAPADIHLQHDWGGYETFGTVEGWIEWEGRRIELSPDQFVGTRDHHWGARDGVGGFSINRQGRRHSHLGQWVEFKDWGLWGDRILYNIGDTSSGPQYCERVDNQIDFDPETRHFRGAVITSLLNNGETRKVRFRVAGNTTAYLRCVGYSSPDGKGTPHGNHHHGYDLGGATFCESYDLADPAVRQEIAGFEDHLCFVECEGETTVGIFECCNPMLYEMCAAGIPSYRFLESA